MQLSETVMRPGEPQAYDLVESIRQKQRLLGAGDAEHRHISTALIIGSGAMRGKHAGGVVTALEELGLTETFDNVIGISAGAATAAYFLAGQAEYGTRIYSEELASREFIDFRRYKNILNIGYLEEVFTKLKPLDQPAIHANRSNFHIGMTNIGTARPEYMKVDSGNKDKLIRYIQASSSVPGLTPPVDISGTLYGDGVTTCKNPISYAIDQLGATDVLCIFNQPLRQGRTPLGDLALSRLLTAGYSVDLRLAYRSRHEDGDENSDTTYDTNARIGIICPKKALVGHLTTNAPNLVAAARAARQQTLDLFNQ